MGRDFATDAGDPESVGLPADNQGQGPVHRIHRAEATAGRLRREDDGIRGAQRRGGVAT